MTTGAIIFANNNLEIDYTKLAVYSATRVKEYLDIPVSLITDNLSWVEEAYPDHPFDKVIHSKVHLSGQKWFYDGSISSKKLDWKNSNRFNVYDLTPYDTTLVIDSDYIINSQNLKPALDRDLDLQIYSKSLDLSGWRKNSFNRINQYSIPFYWATTFIFRKGPVMESFFKLVSYIKENWQYFKILYNIDSPVFRNDHAFSIAIHIMNGKTNGEFAAELPGTMVFATDCDYLVSIKGSEASFLVEKENHLGEYFLTKTTGMDVHILNKMSLSRFIDGGTGV